MELERGIEEIRTAIKIGGFANEAAQNGNCLNIHFTKACSWQF